MVTADRVLVLDYKTNRPPPRDVEQVRRSTSGRWRPTGRCCARPSPAGRWSASLVWTYGARLMPLPADLLDRHAAVAPN